jgi:hypothetical protein
VNDGDNDQMDGYIYARVHPKLVVDSSDPWAVCCGDWSSMRTGTRTGTSSGGHDKVQRVCKVMCTIVPAWRVFVAKWVCPWNGAASLVVVVVVVVVAVASTLSLSLSKETRNPSIICSF